MTDTKIDTSGQTIARRSPSRSTGGPLLIALDRTSDQPLHRQIYTTIRDAILAQRLAAGARLPPSRTLADEVGVSRTTVVLAYEQLETEGYIGGRGSAGSFVSELQIPRATRRAPSSTRLDSTAAAKAHTAVALASSAAGLPQVRNTPVPFRLGEPALDLFPVRLWARLYARRARRASASLLGYGDPGGHRPLRTAIAAYVSASRGVNATADQVILARGTQQAIHLATRLLIARDDRVWVEDPGYLGARALLQSAGASIVPVPVDEHGLVVEEGIRRGADARLAYVAPSHQFPLGVAMSLPRRLALLDWAARAGAWILEDDYDSEFRYGNAPLPSLQGLDTRERVIYLGTFSKSLFPSLRLGYLIVPPALVDGFRAIQAVTDHVAANIEHATLAEFIDAGHFARHVRAMRATYARRQAALLRGIARELDGVIDATAAETGMHLIGWLRDRSFDDALVARHAREAGVEVAPLSMYTMRARFPSALLLGFAAIRTTQMGPALRTLRKSVLSASRAANRR